MDYAFKRAYVDSLLSHGITPRRYSKLIRMYRERDLDSTDRAQDMADSDNRNGNNVNEGSSNIFNIGSAGNTGDGNNIDSAESSKSDVINNRIIEKNEILKFKKQWEDYFYSRLFKKRIDEIVNPFGGKTITIIIKKIND